MNTKQKILSVEGLMVGTTKDTREKIKYKNLLNEYFNADNKTEIKVFDRLCAFVDKIERMKPYAQLVYACEN